MNVGFRIPNKVDTELPQTPIRPAPISEFCLAQLAVHRLGYGIRVPYWCDPAFARDPPVHGDHRSPAAEPRNLQLQPKAARPITTVTIFHSSKTS